MAFTIAFSGKGGTGKTTLAALTVRYLAEQVGGSVLAVDADPNSNLGQLLGVEAGVTVASVREEAPTIAANLAPGMSKDRELEYRIQQSVVEAPKFDLITMGRPEGPKCYCYVNHLLRGFLDRVSGDYRFVVIDNEAGMEHLSRRTTNDVDVLIVAAEPTVVAVEAAKRIFDISESLPIVVRRKVFVLTRVPVSGLAERTRQRMAQLSLEAVAEIPYDDAVYDAAANGETVFSISGDNAACRAAGRMMQGLVPTDDN